MIRIENVRKQVAELDAVHDTAHFENEETKMEDFTASAAASPRSTRHLRLRFPKKYRTL